LDLKVGYLGQPLTRDESTNLLQFFLLPASKQWPYVCAKLTYSYGHMLTKRYSMSRNAQNQCQTCGWRMGTLASAADDLLETGQCCCEEVKRKWWVG